MQWQNVQLQLGTEGPPEVLRVHLGQLARLPLRPPRHEAVPDNLVRPPEVTRPVPHTFTRSWSCTSIKMINRVININGWIKSLAKV